MHASCACESLSPLLGLGHEQDLLLHSLVRFARRANVDHCGAPQVTSGQALHSRRHSGCKHDRLQTQSREQWQNLFTKKNNTTKIVTEETENTLMENVLIYFPQ